MGGKLIHEQSTKYDWRFHSRGPRRVDATNEHQPGIRRERRLHRILGFPHIVCADHFGLTLEWRIGQEVP